MKLKNWNFKTTFLLILLAIVAVVLSYVLLVPRAVDVEITQVTKGIFKETIRADGILRSKERYTVPAFADGDIKRVALKVGDTVKKGQMITELFWSVDYRPLGAPIDGVISKVFRESAGPIRRGDPIVEIVDPSNLEIMVELLTSDALRLRPGGAAWIENWMGGPPFSAKVSRVSKAGYTKQSALGVEEERTEVTAELGDEARDPLKAVGNSFHVEVTFLVSEIADAIKVPAGSIFRDRALWAVYVVENETAYKRNIDVIKIGADEVSVRAGLVVGERVIVYPGDLVKDGVKVRAQN